MPVTINAKYNNFKVLHEKPGAFVTPNPSDAGTARMLTAVGFDALATTSADYAFSIGKKDSAAAITRDDILQNAADIVAATDLPVSVDLENGFCDTPDGTAQTIRLASEIGLIGGSIEDASGNSDDPIYDIGLAVERIVAASEVSKDLPFLLTARAENYLHDRPDLEDTINRLQAFQDAGADVLCAPGLRSLEDIRTVCASVDLPVNVVMGLVGPLISVEDLAAVGVKRISVGGSFARAALGGFMRAALEVKEKGRFTYANDAMSGADAASYLED
jgi:2-methylisocitrate lyase-like PEP mutase family enzyme